MDIQKATEEKLERKMQMGVPIDETILEGLIEKKLLTEEAAQRLLAQKNDLNKETRKNVVSVRISDDVMSIIDDLITSGHVNSRSEGASYLIMLGVKSHYSFFNELSKEVVVIEEQRKKIKYLIESALIFPEKSPNSRLIE
ncbi:hypothetical protein GCM10008014_09390 [Paenibacillus silvae]|uniref:Uncharacterized protein n=1 Tax=Paenibacillus silvae TaxID=1325358 RepID=A0ABQ1Z2L1_9BACL|nr:hypothetical protein [Paenibacillus silvae]GGH46628.1 hypothetical protein GCM10008014_09390 [Paenibacillus silvae]